MKNSKVKKILIELVFCFLQIIFSRINIFEICYPVGFSFAIVRVFFEHNIISVAVSYFVSKLFIILNIRWFLVTGFEIIVLSLFYFANEYFKVKNKWIRISLFAVASKALEFYFLFSQISNLYIFLLGFCISLLSVFYFMKLFVLFKNKFIFFRFSSYDYFMFSIAVLLLGIGIYEYDFIARFLGLFLIGVIVVFGTRIFQADKIFTISGTFSIGAFLATGNIQYMVLPIIAVLIFINFKDTNKYIFIVLSSLVFGAFVFVFQIYDVFLCVSLYFSIFLFGVFPNNFIMRIRELFETDAVSIIGEEDMNHKLSFLQSKLAKMSETLNSMKNNLKFLLVGKIDRTGASVALSQDIINKCCRNCENFRICFYGNINKTDYVQNMLLKAIENNGIKKEDVSSGLSCYCNKMGIMISEINQLASIFLSYEKSMKSEDSSKLIISDELGNFADIFTNFASMLNDSAKVNKKISLALKESFIKAMIDVKEIRVFEDKNGICKISAIITNSNALKKEVIETIQKVTKTRMEIKEIKHLECSGISLVDFVPVPKLRIDFAISTKAKEQRNGDNVTVTKIGENKFFIALSDGMGHGDVASRTSLMVLELIKSMFEIGIDSKLIIESVNKLLLPAGLDNFSTLDACVIDLNKAKCDFIKLGASVSVLKHASTSEIVKCDSLPIGIVQNLKPTIISKNLYVGDMIFIASDGVVDSYSDIHEYKNFINDSKIYNLQSFTDSVISDADYMSSAHKDDMTIIAVNLLKNY